MAASTVRRLVVALVLFSLHGAAAWAVLGINHLREAAREVNRAVALVEGIPAREPTSLAADPPRAVIEDARVHLGRAGDHLDAASLAPLRRLPVASGQWRAIRQMAGNAERALSVTGDVIDEVTPLLEAGRVAPEDRVPLLRRAAEGVDTLASELQRVSADMAAQDRLIGPLGSRQREFERRVDSAAVRLREASTTLGDISELLDTDQRLLVLAANNAEMRVATGMVLQVGIARLSKGNFTIESLESIIGWPIPEGSVSTDGLDPDLLANWDWLKLRTTWQNLHLSPRFDANAELAMRMWSAAGGPAVDGVLQIDIEGLVALAELGGPVDVDNRSLDAGALRQFLLVDQYGFDDSGERRGVLRSVASDVATNVSGRPIDIARVPATFSRLARGRHLLLYSREARFQALWARVGLAGLVPHDAVVLALTNRGGDKLDPFLTIAGSLTAKRRDGGRRVTVRLEVTNGATGSEAPYALGSAKGRYTGMVVAQLPAGASAVQLVTGNFVSRRGVDGGREQLVAAWNLGRGESGTIELHFDVPETVEDLTVLPSGRIQRMCWSAGDTRWADVDTRRVHVEDLHEELPERCG